MANRKSSPGFYRGIAVEADSSALSDKDVVATFRPGLRMPAVVAVALITSLGSVIGTYMLTHQTPADCASKADLHAIDTHVAQLAETVTTLTSTISRNADQAHNDTRDVANKLDAYIVSHAK